MSRVVVPAPFSARWRREMPRMVPAMVLMSSFSCSAGGAEASHVVEFGLRGANQPLELGKLTLERGFGLELGAHGLAARLQLAEQGAHIGRARRRRWRQLRPLDGGRWNRRRLGRQRLGSGGPHATDLERVLRDLGDAVHQRPIPTMSTTTAAPAEVLAPAT